MHRVLKLLSEDPANYKDAPREGIRRVLEEVSGRPHPRDAPLKTSRILSIRMGTTVSSFASNTYPTWELMLVLFPTFQTPQALINEAIIVLQTALAWTAQGTSR